MAKLRTLPEKLAAKVNPFGKIEKRWQRDTGYNEEKGGGHTWKEGRDGRRET